METLEQKETTNNEARIKEAEKFSETGTKFSQIGKYSEAYNCFERAKNIYESIGEKSKAALELRYMGFIKDTMGSSPKAIEHYKQSKQYFEELNDQKEACESAYRLAASLYRENRIDESLDEYKYASKDENQNSNVFNNLGFVLVQKGNLDEAEENFSKAEKNCKPDDENYGLIKNNIGVINCLKGNLEKAEPVLEEATKDKVKKNDRTIQYILLANKEEKVEDRFFCYDDVLTLAGIIMNTATVKSLLGKHQEACEYAARALEMDNGMSYLYAPAGWVYLAAGNKEKAISLFKNSLAKAKDKEKIEKIILEINPYAFQKVERNELCPCGSGKKYKKCHGR